MVNKMIMPVVPAVYTAGSRYLILTVLYQNDNILTTAYFKSVTNPFQKIVLSVFLIFLKETGLTFFV